MIRKINLLVMYNLMSKIIHCKNGSRSEENGWIKINVKGSPREIGVAHGMLLHNEIREVIDTMRLIIISKVT